MSQGLLKCSICNMAVNQAGEEAGKYWFHWEDKSKICDGATPIYAKKDGSDIRGKLRNWESRREWPR
jgi:hypothetical protein